MDVSPEFAGYLRVVATVTVIEVAALGHVVGDAGEDKTGEANHSRSMGYLVYLVNWHRNCTVIAVIPP